jgi:hypothetical protein
VIRRCFAAAAALTLSAGLLGCGGFDRLDFTYDSAPLANTSVTFEEIRIPVGFAVGVEARPIDGDEVMDEDTLVRLDSKSPGVLGVGPQEPEETDDDDTQVANWKFVFWGVSEGSTKVTVTIDDEIEAEIPATVTAQ